MHRCGDCSRYCLGTLTDEEGDLVAEHVAALHHICAPKLQDTVGQQLLLHWSADDDSGSVDEEEEALEVHLFVLFDMGSPNKL